MDSPAELRLRVASPLYRLPQAAFTVSFPALLADGILDKPDQLEWFWGWAQDINRGLDNANIALNSGQSDRLRGETERLTLKCRQLLEGRHGDEPPIATVRKILARHATN